MHTRPVHLRSTQAKNAAITHIPVPHPSRSTAHFSDRTALACNGWLTPWPRREASALRKTRNQFTEKLYWTV